MNGSGNTRSRKLTGTLAVTAVWTLRIGARSGGAVTKSPILIPADPALGTPLRLGKADGLGQQNVLVVTKAKRGRNGLPIDPPPQHGR